MPTRSFVAVTWAQGAEPAQLGRELAGATVGLVGFGRIGRRVAELIGGFRCAGAVQRARRGPDRSTAPAP